MKTAIMNFIRDEEGASAIEYALIAGIIAVAIVASLQGVRDALKGIFTQICTGLGTTC